MNRQAQFGQPKISNRVTAANVIQYYYYYYYYYRTTVVGGVA